MGFAENLKKLREAEGITTAELAEYASVTQPTIVRYENGQKLPNVITGVLIAKRLGTTVEALVNKTRD